MVGLTEYFKLSAHYTTSNKYFYMFWVLLYIQFPFVSHTFNTPVYTDVKVFCLEKYDDSRWTELAATGKQEVSVDVSLDIWVVLWWQTVCAQPEQQNIVWQNWRNCFILLWKLTGQFDGKNIYIDERFSFCTVMERQKVQFPSIHPAA